MGGGECFLNFPTVSRMLVSNPLTYTIFIDLFSRTVYVGAYTILFMIFMYIYVFQGTILRTTLLKLIWMTHSKTHTHFADHRGSHCKSLSIIPKRYCFNVINSSVTNKISGEKCLLR